MTTPPSDDLVAAPDEIALLVLGKSVQECADFFHACPSVAKQCRLVQVANPNKKLGGYAAIANPFIEDSAEVVVGVVHADTRFDEQAIPRLGGAAKAGFIVGLVGRAQSGNVWGRNGGGFVSTLDSCSVFFRKDTGLRFDGKNFDDFHCLVEDLCLQARRAGICSFVPAVEANHLGYIDRPGNWMDNYARYRKTLSSKWWGTDSFWTT